MTPSIACRRVRRAILALILLAGCHGAGEPPAERGTPAIPAHFVESSVASGIDFVHRHGGTGERYLIETMGSGVALFDYDGDGDLDVYLVQSGPVPGDTSDPPMTSVLYRNSGDGSFEDVTAEAGVGNAGSYGMGASAADYDNDGWVDLYVTNFGANRLYHNEGGGRFRDVTDEANVGDPLWSVSAAWADFDSDGLLDLYVANYVDFTMKTHKWCGRAAEKIQAYCHPDQYNGVPPRLYMNRGDGTFVDRTREAGLYSVVGKGLGVVVSDLDDDGDLDIFAANDSTTNYLWRNRGDGTFEEASLASGLGYSEDGLSQACMGVDAGDYDRDGLLDVFVTNLDLEYNTLYKNAGNMSFNDVSYGTGVAEPHLIFVGFGTEFFDYDLDGWLDLMVVNGHVIDNIEEMNDTQHHAQPKSLFRNLGNGTFAEISAGMPDLQRARVGRGAAFGDVDGDGDVDVLVSNNNQSAELLINHGDKGKFLVVATEGRKSNRQGIGARITIEVEGTRRVEEVRAGTSYASSSDPRVTFGLGHVEVVDVLEVRWPSGQIDRHQAVPANSWITVVEGEPTLRIETTRR